MPKGNGKDLQLQRAQFRKTLQRLSPKDRVDALISQDDARAAVRSVPADDLYRTIADVGLADTTELVQLASPQQFQTFVDLGTWKKDSLDVHQLLTWIRAAHGDEEEEFLKKLDGIDMELVELLLRKTIVIHDLEENPDVNPGGVTMESPEGKYLIEFKVEGPELSGLRSMLNSLTAKDPFAIGRLYEAVRWEIDTELEEEAYKFRAARLQDLGFPELFDALGLFSWVDPEKVGAPEASAALSSAIARAGVDADYLGAALSGLTDEERDKVEEELRFLANQTLVAEGADPGDLEAMKRVAEMARDYLSLGFEHMTGGDPSRAAELVRAQPLKRIFQVGFSLTLKLKFRVDRMLKLPAAKWAGGALLMLEDEARTVRALNRKRPLKAVKVVGAEPMPFRARRELQEAGVALDRAEAQMGVIWNALGGSETAAKEKLARFDAPLSQLGAERLFAAMVGNSVLTGDATAAPVPLARFDELSKTVVSDRAKAREKAISALRAFGPEDVVGAMVDRVLQTFVEEWGKVVSARGVFDPKLVQAVPVEGMKTV